MKTSIVMACSPAALICLILAIPSTGFAQAQSADAEIRALRQQMAVMEAKLKELESRSIQTEVKAPAPQVPAAAAPASRNISESVSGRETFYQDRLLVARPDNVALEADTGYIRMGRTELRFGGFAKVDVTHDFKPIGSRDSFDLGTIPVGPSLSSDNTSMSVRQSRVGMDMRRETRLGTLRFVYVNDFFGAGNSTNYNLLHLYGQLDNLLLGTTFSTLMDVDSFADTLDYNGPVGKIFNPQPQIRYTFKMRRSNTVAVAVEKPAGDFNLVLPVGVAIPTSPVPDFVARYRHDGENSHFQVGTVLRSVGGYIGATGQDHALGWGLSFSGSIKTFGKDVAAGQFNYGNGIGRYMTGPSGRGVDAYLNQSLKLDATPTLGWMGSYQHFWTGKLRSSVFASHAGVDNGMFQSGDTYKDSTYFGTNMIWTPLGALNFGVEYLYGWQELKNGQKGNSSRLQFAVKYNIFDVADN